MLHNQLRSVPTGEGLHVIAGEDRLTVTVESAPRPGGCSAYGVVAHSHGRREGTLVDTPVSAGRCAWCG